MQIKETVYKGYDNTVELSLTVDGTALVHTGITRVQVVVGSTLLDSLITPTLFDTTHADRLILKLGTVAMLVGEYIAKLVIFDNAHNNGIVWGTFYLKVV